MFRKVFVARTTVPTMSIFVTHQICNTTVYLLLSFTGF